MADLTEEQNTISSLLEPLRIGTAAVAGMLLQSILSGGEPAIAAISLLMVAQAWMPGVDQDMRGTLVAGSLLIPLAGSWDPVLAAIVLAVIMLQGSWVGYLGSLVTVAGIILLQGGGWQTFAGTAGPSAIMAAGTLSAGRLLLQQLALRNRLQSTTERLQQAQYLNDEVIQQLSTSVWAGQQGDLNQSVQLSEQALRNARRLVARLTGNQPEAAE